MGDTNDSVLSPGVTPATIEAYFDVLSGDDRILAARALGPRAQRRLWDLAEGRAVALSDLVPDDREPLRTVRHYGRNTLPVFTEFEKRFCRPAAGATELSGYNEGVTRQLVGPGFFVVRATPGDERGAVVIDYTRVPTERPDSWPDIEPNERGLSRFVYAGMHDFLRRVSRHVTIGRAWRHGKQTANCFVLCREE